MIEQKSILLYFTITLFFLNLSCIGLAGIMLDQNNAIVIGCIMTLGMFLWYHCAVRIFNRFSYKSTDVGYDKEEEEEEKLRQLSCSDQDANLTARQRQDMLNSKERVKYSNKLFYSLFRKKKLGLGSRRSILGGRSSKAEGHRHRELSASRDGRGMSKQVRFSADGLQGGRDLNSPLLAPYTPISSSERPNPQAGAILTILLLFFYSMLIVLYTVITFLAIPLFYYVVTTYPMYIIFYYATTTYCTLFQHSVPALISLT